MIAPIKAYAVVTKLRPTLNVMDIYSKRQADDLELEPNEYLVEVHIEVISKKKNMRNL